MRGYHTKSDLTCRRALREAQEETEAAGGRKNSVFTEGVLLGSREDDSPRLCSSDKKPFGILHFSPEKVNTKQILIC